MADEFGPWQEHDGKPCPSWLIGKLVQVEMLSPVPLGGLRLPDVDAGRAILVAKSKRVFLVEAVASAGIGWDWRNYGRIVDGAWVAKVLRYRLRRPDALRRLVDLAESVPADPIRETVPREGVSA